ncbi:MAG: hypothetical protein ACREL5_06635 [Gemmatimonadales bacterium]
MTGRRKITWFVAVIAAAAGAVWLAFRPGHSSETSARLSLTIRGSLRGSMRLPAKVRWCPVTRTGMLEAVSGDTGVAIVLYERDSLTALPHAILRPEAAGAAARPASSMVMRWVRLGGDTALAMYRSTSGTVRLKLSPGVASGDVNARLQSITGTDALQVTGTFRDLPVATTAAGCS